MCIRDSPEPGDHAARPAGRDAGLRPRRSARDLERRRLLLAGPAPGRHEPPGHEPGLAARRGGGAAPPRPARRGRPPGDAGHRGREPHAFLAGVGPVRLSLQPRLRAVPADPGRARDGAAPGRPRTWRYLGRRARRRPARGLRGSAGLGHRLGPDPRLVSVGGPPELAERRPSADAPSDRRSSGRWDAAWRAATPALVGVVAFAIARSTLLPGLALWDTGEFQIVAPVLGTAHPTGYPSYVLLGWIANALPAPFGELRIRDPAEQDVAGVPRGMGRAEHGRHDLELAGVPQAQAGEQRGAGDRERDDSHERRGRGPPGGVPAAGRPAIRGRVGGGPMLGWPGRAGAAHQPRVRAQAIPQACTATEATIRPATSTPPQAAPRPRPARSRSVPSATGTSRNGAKSRLKR